MYFYHTCQIETLPAEQLYHLMPAALATSWLQPGSKQPATNATADARDSFWSERTVRLNDPTA